MNLCQTGSVGILERVTAMKKEEIRNNIVRVRERIRQAALAAGRDPGEIKLMLAAKYQPLENLLAAVEAGETLFGHNLIPQLETAEIGLREAAESLSDPTALRHRTTVIGHVQSNKLSAAMEYADRIDTVDNFKTARRINHRRALLNEKGAANAVYPILLQVNSAHADTQFGCAPKDLPEMAKRISEELPFVKIEGLMTIGANTADREAVIRSFEITRALGAQLRELPGLSEAKELSMGMTGDLELAVEHGSTMVRIGTAVFGPRPGASK